MTDVVPQPDLMRSPTKKKKERTQEIKKKVLLMLKSSEVLNENDVLFERKRNINKKNKKEMDVCALPEVHSIRVI